MDLSIRAMQDIHMDVISRATQDAKAEHIAEDAEAMLRNTN